MLVTKYLFSCLLISIAFLSLSSSPLVSLDVWDKVNFSTEEQKQTIPQYIAAQLVILIFLRIRVGLTWAKVAPPLFPRSRCLDNLRRPTLFFLTHNLFSLFNLVFVPEKSNQVAHDVLEAFSLQCFISLFILNVDPSNLISAVFILDSHDKLQKHGYDDCRILYLS